MRAQHTRLHRPSVLAVLLGGVALAAPAVADDSQPYPPPCDASTVTKADVERAHTVYLSGKGFLEESSYDKAISYFKDAYSIDCSVHGILPVIATAYERKGDRVEAVRALEEYLRRAQSPPDQEIVERRIRNLKDQIAREQAASSAASAPAPASSAPASAPSASASETAPATPPPAALAPAPVRVDRSAHGPIPWVLVGLGAATFATGAVLFAVGANDVSSALKACDGSRSTCPTQSATDQGNGGRQLEQVGVPVLGAGLGVAAAGVVWHLLERGSEAASPPSGAAQIAPVVAPGYGGVSFRRSF